MGTFYSGWIWLLAAILPMVEAIILLKGDFADFSKRRTRLILIVAVITSAITLVSGWWLFADQRSLVWTCLSMLIFLHIGVLVQLLFHRQIAKWFESRSKS